MKPEKKSFAGGAAGIVFLAFLVGCLLGIVIGAPIIARMVVR